MNFTDISWWEIFIAGISTLAIYSFLIRENSFFRFFEHLFIGIATGIGVSQSLRTSFWQEIVKPMLGRDRLPFPDGTYAEPYNTLSLLYLLPMAFGLLYYFILSRRYNWLAQLTIGLSLGASAGLSFKAFFNEAMPQLYDSFRPLYIPGNLWESFSNTVFIITLASTMSYFFFTFRRKERGIIASTSSMGRWMMMICFGAFFGSTIMARMALLVERLQFLIEQWIRNFQV